MLVPRHPIARATLILSAAVIAACGEHRKATPGDSTTAMDSAGGATPAGAAAATTATGAPAAVAEVPDTLVPLTDADIDRYRKGMTAELAHVEAKAANYKAAKSATDSISASFALSDQAPQDSAGARGAGIDVRHWQTLKRAVDAVLGRRQTAGLASRMQQQIDTTQLTPEMRQRVRENLSSMQDTAAYSGLPADNVKLVLAHGAELDSLRLAPAALALRAIGGKPPQ